MSYKSDEDIRKAINSKMPQNLVYLLDGSDYDKGVIEEGGLTDTMNDPLRSSPREEYLLSAYIDGRNAARDGKPFSVPDFYSHDSLASINWDTGYHDYLAEVMDESYLGDYLNDYK